MRPTSLHPPAARKRHANQAQPRNESAVEQLALDFIKNHGESTSDAARVLATAYGVSS
ncbi:hypothetical protein [Streptomyces sp. G-G2]|uniref:hypothetical protein n=1 Tax=Streptomyces sp. G-G2 TaxID=3046201 RepID=UPI0024B8D2E1|nr:hypothetical protein [Streptomyces sp. G-G2]MDJ0384207.1 hypothetical protein [Streptomyces sp. G-G2]